MILHQIQHHGVNLHLIKIRILRLRAIKHTSPRSVCCTQLAQHYNTSIIITRASLPQFRFFGTALQWQALSHLKYHYLNLSSLVQNYNDRQYYYKNITTSTHATMSLLRVHWFAFEYSRDRINASNTWTQETKWGSVIRPCRRTLCSANSAVFPYTSCVYFSIRGTRCRIKIRHVFTW